MQSSPNSPPLNPRTATPAIPASWGRALDLASLAKPAAGPAPVAGISPSSGGSEESGRSTTMSESGNSSSPYVIDVTEQSFQADVVTRSQQVLVVLDFWAEWCQPCKQLSPVLEALAVAADGAWVLAKIDIEANPRVASVFGVQSIPTVVAIAAAQPIDAFSGVHPEPQLRSWLATVLDAAAGLGVGGSSEGGSAGVGGGGVKTRPRQQAPVDDRPGQAADLVRSGDLDGAQQIFTTILAESPADAAAIAGVAQVKLMRRLGEIDAEQVRNSAGAPQALSATMSPTSGSPTIGSPTIVLDYAQVELQCQAADVEFAEGAFDVAFARLISVVKLVCGPDKDRALQDRARLRLLELLSILPADEPSVGTARRELSNALF